MTTPQQADATPVDADATPQAGTSDAQAADETLTLDELKKVRAEAASLRKRAKEAEARLASIDAEKLTAEERTQRELAKLQAERDTLAREMRTLRAESAAAKAGAVYPDAVAKLLDPEAEDMAAEIARIRKAYPNLFQQQPARVGSADAAATGKAPASADFNALIRRAAGRG